MFSNIPILYPLGFFDNLYILSDNIVTDFWVVSNIKSLELLPVFPRLNTYNMYISNYNSNELAIKQVANSTYFLNWQLLYPIAMDLNYLNIKQDIGINVEFDEILIKSNFANVSQQEYWAVLPQYFYDNEFRLSYYFYFLEPWNIFQIENLEVFTPYYLFLTGIVPILSETLIIGPNKFNLLPEYLLSDLSIHV